MNRLHNTQNQPLANILLSGGEVREPLPHQLKEAPDDLSLRLRDVSRHDSPNIQTAATKQSR